MCSLVYFIYVWHNVKQCSYRDTQCLFSRNHIWILVTGMLCLNAALSLYIYVLSVWTWWVSEQNCSSGINEFVWTWVWQSDINSRFSFFRSVLSSLALAQFSLSPFCIFKVFYWSNFTLYRWRETAGKLVAGLGRVAKNLSKNTVTLPLHLYGDFFPRLF